MCVSYLWRTICLLAVCIICMPSPVRGATDFDTLIEVPPEVAPLSVGSNTQLNLFDGGALPDGFVVGSGVGSVSDTEINIFGGHVEGSYSSVIPGSVTNISGGTVTGMLSLGGGATLNISGGEITNLFIFRGGNVNVFGTDFAIDGEPIVGLSLGEAFSVTPSMRGDVLTARLDDGSLFSMNLTGSFVSFNPEFPSIPGIATSSELTVTLIPEPGFWGVGVLGLTFLGRRLSRRTNIESPG